MITEIGKHKVKCGSLTQGIEDLMGSVKADIIYSDPPWGQANISYWQTMNNKDTGADKEQIDYNDFLNICFSTYQKYGKNLLFVEYGIKWHDDIIAYGNQYGFKHVQVIRTEYASGSKWYPLDLHIFAKEVTPEIHGIATSAEYIHSVQGTHGFDTLRKAVTPFAKAGDVFLDPMCGMGYTAQIAINSKGVFYGNELNAKRLQKTITRLMKDSNN